MKKILLVRHGSKDLKERRFIGITDVPLSDKGRTEAKRAGMWIARYTSDITEADNLKEDEVIRPDVSIYASPLSRCVETAGNIAYYCNRESNSIIFNKALMEVNMGRWENVPFDEIKRKYPDLYEERGKDLLNYRIPEGETLKEAGERFLECVKQIKDDAETVVVVAHKGVIKGALCVLDPALEKTIFDHDMALCGITELNTENGLSIKSIGETQWAVPGEDRIKDLYEKYDVSDNVRRHMKKVSEVISGILSDIDPEGRLYDREVLKSAALLHDIAKREKNHPAAGGKILEKEGAGLIGRIIAEHNNVSIIPRYKDKVSEEDILYYADKIVMEDEVVGLSRRFEESLKKCATEAARENHNKRYEKAKYIENKLREGKVTV